MRADLQIIYDRERNYKILSGEDTHKLLVIAVEESTALENLRHNHTDLQREHDVAMEQLSEAKTKIRVMEAKLARRQRKTAK